MRYPLLLRHLLKYTPDEAQKAQLESALDKLEGICHEINEETRNIENQISVEKLMQRITNYSVFSKRYGELVTPTRRFIEEGDCVPVKMGKSATLVEGKPEFILFNDLLLYVKKTGKDTLKLKEWFSLDGIIIKSEGNGNYFTISRDIDGKEFTFDADFGKWYQTLSLIKTGCFVERENDIDRNSMKIGDCFITKDSADTTRLKFIANTGDGFIDEPIIISGRFKRFSLKVLSDPEGNPVTFDSLDSLIDGVKSVISQE